MTLQKDDFKTHVSAQEAQELSLATPLASTSQQSIIGQGGPDDLGPVSSRPSTAMLTAEALLDKKKRAKQRSKKGPNPLSVKKSKSKRKKTSSMSAVKESEEAQKQGKPKERKMRKKAKDRMTSGSGAEKEASSAN